MTISSSASNPASAASIARYLGGAGFALWLLVMALQPDVGVTAPWLWMGLFWFLQIGSGLVLLQSLLYLFSRSQRLRQWHLWLLVAGSGIAGSALLAPLYWVIEEGLVQMVPGFEANLDDDEPEATAGFCWQALLEEFVNVVGPVTAAWILISWPRLQGLLPPLLLPPPNAAASDSVPEREVPASAGTDGNPAWRAALPPELGDDLVAVSSELQYLRVWTTRGSTLILGALQDVEDSEATSGMRVHRSWWVHASHVRSVRRRSAGLVCQLSDGREIPVSRRRRAEVLARFGDSARYGATLVPPPAPPETQ
jgi:hypothetical protein